MPSTCSLLVCCVHGGLGPEEACAEQIGGEPEVGFLVPEAARAREECPTILGTRGWVSS